LFNTGTSGSIFGQTKSAGLAQSTPSSAFGTFGATPAGQTPGNFSFPSFQTAQQGTDNTLFFWGHWEIGSFCIIIGT
jgi:hypothetical protein